MLEFNVLSQYYYLLYFNKLKNHLLNFNIYFIMISNYLIYENKLDNNTKILCANIFNLIVLTKNLNTIIYYKIDS